jgi:hypothetical protein
MSKSENHKDFKKPFKLEEFPRENMYKVPDGYFDELPGIIQQRVTKKSESSGWREIFLNPDNGWKAALAVAVIALVMVFSGVFNNKTYEGSVEDILAEVSLEDLIQYVEYSDISTEEILAELDFSDYEMNYLMGEDIQLLDESEYEELDMLDLYEVYGIEEELF